MFHFVIASNSNVSYYFHSMVLIKSCLYLSSIVTLYLQAVQTGNHMGQGREAPRITALQVTSHQATMNHVEDF